MVRVFVVTGSNRGIGKSIVKLLLKEAEDKIVYLTSRNVEAGKKAVEEFNANGMHPEYYQLDITDEESIIALREYLLNIHGGFDVLINNAGLAWKHAAKVPAEEMVNCNFFGTLQTCEILLPILRNNGKIVHVSSTCSKHTYPEMSDSWKSKFADEALTIYDLKCYMSQFISDAQQGKFEERVWPGPWYAYGMSKVGVNIMAIIQQRELNKTSRNIVVNACCPGLVDTDMSGDRGPNAITPDEGADTPVYLALQPQNTGIRGSFIYQRIVHPFPPCGQVDAGNLIYM